LLLLALVGQVQAALTGYWRLDEGFGSTTADSGGSHPGSLFNSPQWTTGLSTNALAFDGANQYVRVATGPIVDTLANFTIEAWVKWDGTGYQPYQGIYGESSGTWDKVNLALAYGVPTFHVYTQVGSTWRSIASSYPLDTNQWHHLATVVQSGVGGILYVDGAPVGTNASIGAGASWNPANTVTIGMACSGSTTRGFAGTIDDGQVYNSVRTPAEILADFHAYDSVRLASSVQLQITSLSANGQLAWTNVAAWTNGLFSVEWAPSLSEGWRTSWGTLRGQLTPGLSNTVAVPMFFRVKCAPDLFMPLPVDQQMVYRVSNSVGMISTQQMAVLAYTRPQLSTNDFTLIEELSAEGSGLFLLRSTDNAAFRWRGTAETLEFQIGPVGTTWTNHNCYKFHKQVLEESGSDWYEWICPHLGMVKWVDYWVDPSENPPITYQLQSVGTRP
jgi:hypothetical protein